MVTKVHRIFLLLCLGLMNVIVTDAAKWTYEGNTGPEFWATLPGGELCDGSVQSPINIDTDTVVPKKLGIFELEGYDDLTMTSTEIHNNGHTVQINLAGTFRVTGGGLPSIYTAVQFHFHWGLNNNEGSEHTRNGNPYPAEIHIVNYDSEKYDDILAAITEPRGLAVLGFWVEVGEENPAFDPVFDVMKNLTYKGDIVYFASNQQLKLEDMLPSNSAKFYRYSGSLTTPGCFESVEWTMFEQPITMSSRQLAMFRDLSHLEKSAAPTNMTNGNPPPPIGHNFRPTQDINGRTVYTNTLLGAGSDDIHANLFVVLLLAVTCFLFQL